MHNQEIKICQNCKRDFTIEPVDFAFYEKISAKGGSASGGKVPPPTFCPECRSQRRMMWRNERSFHKRACGLTGKNMISCFSEESGITVYENKSWFSDQWDPSSYERGYDFSKPFFAQFGELLKTVPMPATFAGRSVNSDYCNHIGEAKECYLTFASWDIENVSYSNKIFASKDLFDGLASSHCQLSYEIVQSQNIYNCAFVQNSGNCNHSMFLYDCRGCSDCFGCVGLRNKQYYIFNKSYTKEEYGKKLKEFYTGGYKNLHEVFPVFTALKQNSVYKFAHFINTQNSSGDNLSQVSNCHYCFDLVNDVRDSKFCVNGGVKMADSYDGYGVGAAASLLYESLDTGANGSRMLFDLVVWEGNNALYSYHCKNVKDVFACIGLRNKQYCILNKQYTKEEYEKLVPRIIEHMNAMPYIDQKGRIYKYGEFFPPELSPFAYNETIAQEYFPLTKEEALQQGYRWKDPEEKQYAETITWRDLPDNIKDVSDSILNETILCRAWDEDAKKAQEHNCTKVFRIIPQELAFYRKMSIPLPRLCPNSRHFHRIQQRNPLRLWHRKCMCQGEKSEIRSTPARQSLDAGGKSETFAYQNTAKHFHGSNPCPNEFETSYAPERPEIVYCEKCYQDEVV
jgi:hypothetical protein